jgi:hypothetical protein
MNAQIRAYVFQDRITVARPIEPDSEVTIGFKNFGQTPAVVRTAPATCRYYVSPPDPIVSDEITEFNSVLIAGAGEHFMDLGRTLRVTDTEIGRARKGDGSIRCIFNVNYTDVVGESHVAGLCLTYVYVSSQGGFIVCQESQYRYRN